MANSIKTSQLPIQHNYPSSMTYSALRDPGTNIAARPPIPPPRYQNSSHSYASPWNYNNNYGGYSSYSRPLYNGYNSYSPYQPNHFNSFSDSRMPYDSRYSITEEAQESSREAFANIERIVHTFGSVNMMIESTYYALQSSFNAVLSVAENLSNLKSQFGQILSAFTLIRSVQWLYRKLLYLIGLRSLDPATESAWKRATYSTIDEQLEGSSKKSSWPMLVFIASIYIGPLLMWKFINFLRQKDKPKNDKVVDGDSNYYAIAKYDYKAQGPDELSFSSGDYLKLAPYEKQTDKLWPLASNGRRTGIVPVNYIDIKLNSVHTKSKQPNTMNSNSFQRPTEIGGGTSQKPSPKATSDVTDVTVQENSKNTELVKQDAAQYISTAEDIKDNSVIDK